MQLAMTEVLGTVRPDGTLELDRKLDVPAGRVRVRVEALPPPAAAPAESLIEFVDRARREMEAAGHKFMTDEEGAAWIEELRAEDDRIEEVYRQAEEERRRHGPPS
ncbi:MAG TPA: hypothetical protein VFW33_09775 [Gemmataceae bacterium]|nr:hypothetical protein [Gemmataceae bacterium]